MTARTGEDHQRHQPLERRSTRRVLGVFVIQLLAATLPYVFGTRILGWIHRQETFIRIFHSQRRSLLLRLLHRLDIKTEINGVLQRYLTTNVFGSWRVAALSRMSESELEKWLHVRNIEVLESARMAGKGVVVVGAHFGIVRIVPLILARHGFEIHAVTPHSFTVKIGARGSSRIQVIRLDKKEHLWIRPMLEAIRILKTGGIIGILGDGYQGAGGTKREFLCSTRVFHTGFADLSVRSEAAVLAVFAEIDSAGRIEIEFHGPLTAINPGGDRREQALGLLDQYVNLLEQRWRSNPGNVNERHLELWDEAFASAPIRPHI